MSILPQGVIVPIITPSIHLEILNVIDHLRRGGVKTIFLLGTTGEALHINHKDKLQLIRTVADNLPEDMQFLVGVSSPLIDQSIELMQTAVQAGAVASVISPLIVGEDVLQIIHTLLQSSQGPLFLYNFPMLTQGKFIALTDIQTLLKEPRILGIKDSSADLTYFEQLLAFKNQHPHFKVYYGPENNLATALKMNIDGFVPGTGNLAPQLAVHLWQEKEKGPWDEWLEIKEKINKTDQNYIHALKKCLKQDGIISDASHF